MLNPSWPTGVSEAVREEPGTAAVTYVPRYGAFFGGVRAPAPKDWNLSDMRVLESGPMAGTLYDERCLSPARMDLIGAYSCLHRLRQERPHLDPMFEPDPRTRYGTGKPRIAGASTVTRFGSWQLQERAEIAPRLQASWRGDLKDAPSAGLFPAGEEHLIGMEQKALAALNQMPYRYQKSTNTGQRFGAKIPADKPGDRISYADVFRGLMGCISDFFRAFRQILHRFACSLNTAMQIAPDARAQDVVRRAHRTGMLQPFPGMSDCAMVVSDACPDDILYAVSEPNCSLLMADGPKIVSQDGSGGHIVRDFCGYAYQGAPGAQSGCVIDLAS